MEKAFLFDLNGTMIDDMQYHLKAWYHILNDDLGANIGWEETKRHMYGKNSELLIRIFGKDKFTQAQMDELSLEKEKRYQQEYRPHLKLFPGLQEFLESAYTAGIPMAIGSAAIMFNIDFVLDNLNIRHYFKAIVSADDVHTSKPDPETYIKCMNQLGINNPANCIVFEDAPKGVEASANAGMHCVTITSLHPEEEFTEYRNIIKFTEDYTTITPEGLLQLI